MKVNNAWSVQTSYEVDLCQPAQRSMADLTLNLGIIIASTTDLLEPLRIERFFDEGAMDAWFHAA